MRYQHIPKENHSWVRNIQNLLNERGYFLSCDGVYGKDTTYRVMQFQKDTQCKIDGQPMIAGSLNFMIIDSQPQVQPIVNRNIEDITDVMTYLVTDNKCNDFYKAYKASKKSMYEFAKGWLLGKEV